MQHGKTLGNTLHNMSGGYDGLRRSQQKQELAKRGGERTRERRERGRERLD